VPAPSALAPKVFFADLHIHSRFSRATAKTLAPETLAASAAAKGLALVGTGDLTHPQWLDELDAKLELSDGGFYRLKKSVLDTALSRAPDPKGAASVQDPGGPPGGVRGIRGQNGSGGASGTLFTPTGEISCIWKQGGRARKVHLVVWCPTLEGARKVSGRLGSLGNVRSDGRPILGLSARDALEAVLDADHGARVVPAHVWTPWFSLFGSMSGFDDPEECFGDLTGEIAALETGLSSDPYMNRLVSRLDRYALVSSSDAHGPDKLGREATLIAGAPESAALRAALAGGPELLGTAEFFPEEGKYHLDGHSGCGPAMTPEETRRHKGICPACGKPVTVGVLNRVMELADRTAPPEGSLLPDWHILPLRELLGQCLGRGPDTLGPRDAEARLLREFGSEYRVLLETSLADLEVAGGALLRLAIERMREGKVTAAGGYDGVFGTVEAVSESDRRELGGQGALFDAGRRGRGPVRKNPSPSGGGPSGGNTGAGGGPGGSSDTGGGSGGASGASGGSGGASGAGGGSGGISGSGNGSASALSGALGPCGLAASVIAGLAGAADGKAAPEGAVDRDGAGVGDVPEADPLFGLIDKGVSEIHAYFSVEPDHPEGLRREHAPRHQGGPSRASESGREAPLGAAARALKAPAPPHSGGGLFDAGGPLEDSRAGHAGRAPNRARARVVEAGGLFGDGRLAGTARQPAHTFQPPLSWPAATPTGTRRAPDSPEPDVPAGIPGNGRVPGAADAPVASGDLKSPVAGAPGPARPGAGEGVGPLSAGMLADLNEAQLSCATFGGDTLLVAAGPGSGKTRVLLARAAWLMDRGVAAPGEMLLTTFTRKAAQTLAERLATTGGGQGGAGMPRTSTLHAAALEFLRRGGEDPRIAPEEALDEIAAEAAKGAPISARNLLALISRMKNLELPPGSSDSDVDRAVARYGKALEAAGLADFDDLVALALKLAARGFVSGLKFVLADEAQDLSPLEYGFLKALARGASLTAIGDPAQCIYGFRGAVPSLRLALARDRPDLHVSSLPLNYRSTPVISAASELFRRDDGIARRSALPGRGRRIVRAQLDSSLTEAVYVARCIKEHLGGLLPGGSSKSGGDAMDGLTLGDIAVIYRLRVQGQELLKTLLEEGIPCQISGGDGEGAQDGLDLKAEKVSLLTIHAAKGLEFRLVFVTGLDEGLLPYVPPAEMGSAFDRGSEEERLFYVALTRARELIYLTRVRRRRIHGRLLSGRPSPFWERIPAAVARDVTARSVMTAKPRPLF
jgi:superfamily I DNA/RNA helicase/PHP family Zn ribbon phosphoesterase